MTTGLDAKKDKKNDPATITNGVLGIWSCGCTTIGCVAPVNIRCIRCGNEFKKVSKKDSMNKTRSDKAKIELVNNIQTLYPEEGEGIKCKRCGDTGETKVYTQEWDMIKGHMCPCPDCRSQEWLEWSAGKRLVGNY